MFFSMLQNNIFVLFFPFPAAFPGKQGGPRPGKAAGNDFFSAALKCFCREPAQKTRPMRRKAREKGLPHRAPAGASSAEREAGSLGTCHGASRRLSAPQMEAGTHFRPFPGPLSGGKAAFFSPRAGGTFPPACKSAEKTALPRRAASASENGA